MKFIKYTIALTAVALAACGGPQGGDGGVDVPGAVDVPNNTDRPNPPNDRPNVDVPPMCTAPQTLCNGMCANTQTDPMNCGMCGTACPMGQMCSMGACVPTCIMPEVACGMGPMARCANLGTDNANCGACGTACGMGQTCTAGICTCPMGQTACGMGAMATCVNTMTDTANCGACGMPCPMGNTCVAGACVPPCAAPRTMCGMSCTDTMTDRANCGACGTACPMAQACVAGRCACPMGQTACGMGAATTCVNVQTDRANCGACGTACGMAQMCTAGSCACPMATPNACGMGAATTCTNFQTDPANCGRCGNACAMGMMCTAGVCAPNCAMPNILCGMAPMQTCVMAQTDSNNCGMCGNACGANGACMAGACVPRNNSPATAIALNVPLTGARTQTTGNNAGGATGMGQCDSRAVYYSVTVAAPAILYVDTFGSTFDTRAGIRPMGAAATMACIDDSCGGVQSQTTLVVPAGTHLIEVSGFGGATGAFTLNVAAIPASNGGRNAVITPDLTRQAVRGNDVVMGSMPIAVPGLGNKASDVYYHTTCPNFMAGALHVDTCQSGHDTMLSVLHGGGAAAPTNATDDDGGNTSCVEMGGNWSNITGNVIPAGAGIHAIYATYFSAPTFNNGFYTLHYSLACANNQVAVGGACRPVQALATDAANCGGPGRACAMGSSCSAGVCVAAGGNTNPPALTYAVSEGAGTALANIGGAGGAAFSDACPQGQALIGVRASEAGPFGGVFGTTLVVGHVEGICGTMTASGLLGTAPQRVAFTRAAPNLPARGAPAGMQINARDLLCPPGHVVVGARGATNGNIVDSLSLQCAPVFSTGSGPFTLALGTTILVGAVGGEGNAFTQVARACPAGQIANGVAGRFGSGLDAFTVLCNAPRVFQVQLNNAMTADSQATGGAGGGAFGAPTYDCPAGTVLGGINAGPTNSFGPAISQLRGACRAINGLAGIGNWTLTTAPALAYVGAAVGGQPSIPADYACNSGNVPVGYTAGTSNYIGRIRFHCASPTQSPAGATTLPASAEVPTITGTGVEPIADQPRRDCPANTVATGVFGRAGNVIDSIGLRCTPFVIR